MNDKQNKVINWIRSGMDYDAGIQILGFELGQKQMAMFLTGKNKTKEYKLAYEIMKSVGLADATNCRETIGRIKQGKTFTLREDKYPSIPHLDHAPEKIDDKPLEQYPAIIRRLVLEYAQLFQERSKLHAVMTELPENNSTSVCERREELFSMIKSLSERMDLLYYYKNKYDFDGSFPDEKILYPEVNQEPSYNIEEMDEDALKKYKKNLQTSNSKDNSLLEYQTKEGEAEKNPMPAGPRRVKIERRIKQRLELIEKIDEQLVNNAGKQ